MNLFLSVIKIYVSSSLSCQQFSFKFSEVQREKRAGAKERLAGNGLRKG